MGERDAFGNEKGDNPLESMGWSSGAPTPRDEPAAPVTPPADRPADPPPAMAAGAFGEAPPVVRPPAPPEVPPGLEHIVRTIDARGVGTALRLTMLAVTVAVLGSVGLAIFSVGSSVNDTVQDARRAISTSFDGVTIPSPVVPAAPGAPAPSAPVTPPTGFGKGSLLLRANFAKALRTVRTEGARLRSLRVAPDRIDASILTQDGRMKQVQVTWQGALRRFSSSGPGFSAAGTFTIASLDRSAPFRLARSAAGRSRKAPSSVDYLVALELGQGQAWTVFVKDGGGQYLADHAGRITRKNG